MKERIFFFCKGPAVSGCFRLGTVLTIYDNGKKEEKQVQRNIKRVYVLENLKPCCFEGVTDNINNIWEPDKDRLG